MDVRYDELGIATHDRQTLPAVAATKLTDLTEKANIGKVVLIAALDGTYQRKPFYNIMELIPLAESVSKLNAVCMNCFREAAFTKRTTDEDSLEVIGGADKYMAACRTCYKLEDVKEANSPRDVAASPSKNLLLSKAVSNLGSFAA